MEALFQGNHLLKSLPCLQSNTHTLESADTSGDLQTKLHHDWKKHNNFGQRHIYIFFHFWCFFFHRTLKIHHRQDGESAKGSNRHNWCTSWYRGEYLGFLRHSNWRSSARVKGSAGLLATRMSNRKEEEERGVWLLLLKVLLGVADFSFLLTANNFPPSVFNSYES